MARKKNEQRSQAVPPEFSQARDEMFSHILRCGVLEADPEHQKEWFDDTMLYLRERYETIDEAGVNQLRLLGERYCQPVVNRAAEPETAGAVTE